MTLAGSTAGSLRAGLAGLAGPLLLGLFLRTLLGGFTNTPSVDGSAFLLPLARELLDGDFGDWRWGTFPPLYPIAVAMVQALVGELVLAGQVVSVLAGTLTIIPGALLARRLLGVEEAVVSAWLLAALPLACHYSARPQTEALYSLLFACGVLALVRLVEGHGPAAISLGTLAGLATATRPEGALLLAAGGVVLFLEPPGGRTGRRAGLAAGLLIPFVILAVPGLLIARQAAGRWTLSPKAGYIFQRNLQVDPDEYYFRLTPEGDRLLFETYITDADRAQSLDLLSVPPGRLIATYAESSGRFLLNFWRTFDPPLVLFALLGAILRPRPGWTRSRGAVVALLAAYLILLPLFSSERRFWVPLFVILVPLSALGLTTAARRLATSPSSADGRRRFLILCTILLLLPHAGSPVRNQGFAWRDSPERRLARLIGEGEGGAILSEDGRVAIFAGMDHVFLPVASAADVRSFARLKGARYLACVPDRLRVRRPGLLKGLAADLEEIGEERGRGKRFVLYRFRW